MFFFFFSSRRRHTRLTCDWSSDVCSSDLGTVTPAAFADYGDPTSPYGTTLSPITFTPTPATPPTTITWATFNTSAATAGIHTIWIHGHSPIPYLTDHYYPVAINIGGVSRDFAPTGAGLMVSIPTTGATGTGSFS